MLPRSGIAAVGILSVLGAVAVTGAPDVSRSARLQDQVESLEKSHAQLEGRIKAMESRSAALAERLATTESRIAAELPKDVRVVPLEGGGTERWSLSSGAAYVQFLRLAADDTPVFTIQNAAGSAEVALRAGESHVAIDDRGSELRVYTTTVHRLLRDRTGIPFEAYVTVTYEVRHP